MSAESSGKSVKRIYEQPPDSVACYADLTQTVATETEITIQFYEAIPGPPLPPSGEPDTVRMRLRATVVLNKGHAGKLARNLTMMTSPETGMASPETKAT